MSFLMATVILVFGRVCIFAFVLFIFIKVILNEECVSKHKLLVMDMQFNTTKRWHKEEKT